MLKRLLNYDISRNLRDALILPRLFQSYHRELLLGEKHDHYRALEYRPYPVYPYSYPYPYA